MGPIYLRKLSQRAHHKSRYHHSLRCVGTDISQCHCGPMAHCQTNKRLTIATQERVRLDDMAGAYRLVYNGPRELFTPAQVYKTK
jgi:hypothetical protein